MFKLSLATILAAFTKLESQLEQFIQNNSVVENNKVAELQRVQEDLSNTIADTNRARNVLKRVKALTE